MVDLQQQMNEAFDKLKQERDEVIVKLHLAKTDVQEEWAQLEQKWHQVDSKIHAASVEAKAASKDVGAALGVLQDELSKAYKRIRNQLV